MPITGVWTNIGNGMGDAVSSSGSVSDQTNGITSLALLGGTGSNLPYAAATTDRPNSWSGSEL